MRLLNPNNGSAQCRAAVLSPPINLCRESLARARPLIFLLRLVPTPGGRAQVACAPPVPTTVRGQVRGARDGTKKQGGRVLSRKTILWLGGGSSVGEMGESSITPENLST